MILNIKVKDEDDLKLDTNNIKDEEFSIYTYSEKQLKSICKTLFDIIGNNEISTEDEKNVKKLLQSFKMLFILLLELILNI